MSNEPLEVTIRHEVGFSDATVVIANHWYGWKRPGVCQSISIARIADMDQCNYDQIDENGRRLITALFKSDLDIFDVNLFDKKVMISYGEDVRWDRFMERIQAIIKEAFDSKELNLTVPGDVVDWS